MQSMVEKIAQGRENARVALEAYRGTGHQSEDDLACIGDLIADLLHLADGVNPGDGMQPILGDGSRLARNEQTAYSALEHYRYESDPANADEEV